MRFKVVDESSRFVGMIGESPLPEAGLMIPLSFEGFEDAFILWPWQVVVVED